MRLSTSVALLGLVLSFAPASAKGGTYNTKVSVGDKAATFADIVGVDDKKRGLADYKDAKAVVVVFTCNQCPMAKAYEDRFIAIQKDYADKGVQVIAISVNNGRADKLDKMKERAKKKEFNFPYLHDDTQESARAYGAEKTPQVFLLAAADTEGARKIAYMGAVDNHDEAARATKHFLRDAIDAVLAGKAPATTETKPLGCGIRYDK